MGDSKTPEITGKRGFVGPIGMLEQVTDAFGSAGAIPGSVDAVIQGAAQAAQELTKADDKDAPVAQELLKPAAGKSTNKPQK